MLDWETLFDSSLLTAGLKLQLNFPEVVTGVLRDGFHYNIEE